MSQSTVSGLSPEVLALLAASYGRPAEQVVQRIVTRSENPRPPSKLRQAKQAKAKAEENAPQVEATPRPPMTQVVLPPVGTYDARGFLVALRRAKTRDEECQAIAGYTGFDRHGDFGAQSLAARMKAQREIRGVKALPAPVHTALPTVKGYVAGMPDEQAKHVQNLLAREKNAAEAFALLGKLVADPNACDDEQMAMLVERFNFEPPMIRSQATVLAGIESKRLEQIQADLKASGVRL